MSASRRHRAFTALFPPLLATDAGANGEEDADVDISVDDLQLPPLEKAVDAAIYRALQRWNELEPANVESALTYAERLKKYRAIVSWILYRSDNADDDSDEDDAVVAQPVSAECEAAPVTDESRRDREIAQRRRRAARKTARKEKQREKAKLRKQLQTLQTLFHALPPLETLRAERVPSARLQAFASTYAPKTRTLQMKRSVSDTKTELCFEFARPAQSVFPRKATGDEEDDEDDPDSAEPGATAAQSGPATHNVRTSNYLISRGAGDPTSSPSELSPFAAAEREELVIWLDVLHPSKEPSKTQSFLVRESQTLADVMDLVVCAYDQRLGDHERHSKLVYFDAKFYADRRDPANVDYGDKIREWIRKAPATRGAKYLGGGEHLEDASASSASLSMETTCFRDLALKVDLPGVYIHQGECEHLLRIRDARLPHEFDARQGSSEGGEEETTTFPMRLPNPHFRALRNCFICQQYSAKYVCYGDRMGISDPMFFCERCYRAAHFDRHGELVYRDFQSFPYIQD